MSYMALYRKFRPTSFEDVKGQDHIVTTLKNQIKTGRVGHAYLFCGTRGTGKTSIAKIMARAVNCESPMDGSPCNQCAVCRAINSQASMNVIEIDAASNNGVDNIREIVDEVQYSPTEGKYKVYIIDEVHMLSAGAFNALLKTLEEPPSYVIFILATTEAHKIPITILSRCQRYDFHRITIDTIAGRLLELMGKEGVEAEEKAVRYVAKAADGSMRDALSLLDQCIAFYFGEKLTYDKVLDVLGAVDVEVFDRMFGLIQKQDVMGMLTLVDELVLAGRELGQFITDYTWFLRNLMVLKASEGSGDMVDAGSETLPVLVQDAKSISQDTLIWQIRVFSDLSAQIKYAAQKRVLVEIGLVKLCVPQMEDNTESLKVRMDLLEKKLEEGLLGLTQNPGMLVGLKAEAGQNRGEIKGNTSPENRENVQDEPLPKAFPEEIQQIAANWNQIMGAYQGALKQYMREVIPSASSDGSFELVAPNESIYKLIKQEKNLEDIKKGIEACLHKEVPIQIKCQKQEQKEDILDITAGKVNMPIEFTD